jgi:hypothetical protein
LFKFFKKSTDKEIKEENKEYMTFSNSLIEDSSLKIDDKEEEEFKDYQ